MYGDYQKHVAATLETIRGDGLFKTERLIQSPQGGRAKLADGREVVIMCANNYLGLGNHPEVIAAAHEALDRWGYGMGSVRFICGTQTLHQELEQAISAYVGTEDTILYSSCFDANGGLFETLLTEEDAVISDALNHASIIDGIRLCKARRFRYQNRDMEDLEAKLREAREGGARYVMIATDGVFSMDGTYAPMGEICDLADRYGALVMMDDSHAVGFVGPTGRGTHEKFGVVDRVDIITGTLGKALGGASGGYTSGRREIISLLRQRSRPYLFSNTLAPVIAAVSVKVLEMLSRDSSFRDTLWENTRWYVEAMRAAGFEISAGEHPIVPIMLGDARLAQQMASQLLESGVYAVGFFFPVVPQGKARIRTQVSSALTRADLEQAVSAFVKARAAATK
ncbi:MAG: glycine C-acetyltransferase [Verrucomicrobiota bacterium]|jgi:glycine C-acetyltransferase